MTEFMHVGYVGFSSWKLKKKRLKTVWWKLCVSDVGWLREDSFSE